ncbi:hypothetical protein [Ramlibacter sp.]|uniref:hypothetical protein n=1 Tax=Ramlibacter sp. TaxID=1917967 RepID=UPI003D0FBF5D
MFVVPPSVSVACALVAVAVLISNVAEPQTPSDGSTNVRAEHETATMLEGTWLREYSEADVRVRRLLRLAPGGEFRESVRVVDAAGQVHRMEHEGQWLYDGTNLKRKYTLMDGKPPSRLNVPFATFEVSFATRDEFTGVNHVYRNTVRYRRVEADLSF